MSQKAEALEAYTKQATNYMSSTDWPVLHTAKVVLFSPDEPVPEFDLDVTVKSRVEELIKQAKMLNMNNSFPLFIRACPLNPRPGVLESCRADDWDEVNTVATRIISTMLSPDNSEQPMYESGLIDPQGTVIIQPYINAHASAVVAPNNYILMGRDNDGITAGKDGLRVALPLGDDHNLNRDFDKLNLDPNHIEIEFVSERLEQSLTSSVRSSDISVRQNLAMVQLRGSEGHRPISPAPKGVTISGTFHGAERITIKHIHLVSDNTDEQLDLMEQALREGMTEGSVVLHPNGSHLSHHAGQCFKYGVPYIASAEPKVGEQWTQAALGWVVLDNEGTYEPQPYDPLDYTHAFIEGFDIGFSNFARQHGWLSNHFHQFIGGAIGDAEQTAKLAGAYTAWLINATLSVGFGEVRHTYSNAENSTALVMATAHALYGDDAWNEVTGSPLMPHGRRSYYTVIENNPITLRSVVEAFAFLERTYKLEWSSGYGGSNYGESCANGRKLAESVINFFADSSESNFKDMLSVANLVEHNVHNNGFFFNKFISKTALDWGTDPDTITVKPQSFFSVYYAADHIMTSYPKELNDITDLLALSKSITINQLKETPIAMRKDAIGASALRLSEQFRHPHGKYSNYTHTAFLRCGVHDCERCAQHEQEQAKAFSSEAIPVPKNYEAPFPVEMSELSSATQYLKELSSSLNNGDTLDIKDIHRVAKLVKTNMVHEKAHKYLANIISHMSHEDMNMYAKVTKKE
ncbi:MAG: hypothetical protein ACO23H_06200 [Alphaproteobacteria bacterium]